MSGRNIHHRRTRTDQKRRLINRNFSVVEVDITDVYRDLELVCFDLLYTNDRLRFFVVYRPPQYNDSAEQYLSLLIDCLTLHTRGMQTNIIVGDLNCPEIDWPAASCSSE